MDLLLPMRYEHHTQEGEKNGIKSPQHVYIQSIPFILITFTCDVHANLPFQSDPHISPLKGL